VKADASNSFALAYQLQFGEFERNLTKKIVALESIVVHDCDGKLRIAMRRIDDKSQNFIPNRIQASFDEQME
jgi:hypothetical protein